MQAVNLFDILTIREFEINNLIKRGFKIINNKIILMKLFLILFGLFFLFPYNFSIGQTKEKKSFYFTNKPKKKSAYLFNKKENLFLSKFLDPNMEGKTLKYIKVYFKDNTHGIPEFSISFYEINPDNSPGKLLGMNNYTLIKLKNKYVTFPLKNHLIIPNNGLYIGFSVSYYENRYRIPTKKPENRKVSIGLGKYKYPISIISYSGNSSNLANLNLLNLPPNEGFMFQLITD